MATQDIRSDLQQFVLFSDAIIADAVVNSNLVIDTANYDLGLMFTLLVRNIDPNAADGAYLLSYEESATGVFAGEEVVVSPDKIIGPTINVTVGSSLGALETQGIFSNARFIRGVITATGLTNGAYVVLLATQKAEIKPEPDVILPPGP